MGKFRSLFRSRESKATATDGEPSSGSQSEPASPEAQKEELERVFRKFDSNGDGKISSAELAAIFESLGHPVGDDELERMMSEADSDGDGFISLEEFLDLNGSKVDPTAALEDLRHAFSVFDLDRNGSISAKELARVMRGLGEGASLAECRKMIEGVDRDGDGLISFEEFKVMMSKSSLASAFTKFE
ncbi:putative calcium-binding protein CML10 [Apostasia shenzhenica]|uniref:Putative calcium-binding protein CML10 n=1 Tax=Apostasia shenzhenica TaxID=1088818 RepID=A0A2I0B1T9_9ASPA|nr:putative calcium-binding protein CML10 [Apostasia shenzhenica]